MTLSNEPVAGRGCRAMRGRKAAFDAYGYFISGESMEPAFGRGNILLVNPAAAVARRA